ncbi:Hpt domain-containing protein [Pseudomonas sp. PS02288]|uniref:Hpt domain-containing protein n=1 Tax=Pseudomonas sp. PS02288 TaxID=2991443 RepID=UPI00249CDEEE|nr:Hpt domain-containing protein [Pseudomonas sp. PS02288]
MGDRHDYVALEWVKGEIAETLKQARQALEAFVENPQDSTRMSFCLTYVHQVQGTLQMVEFYGAALLAEEMERLAQALMEGRVNNQREALEVLMQAILQLPTYLERVQSARRDLPMVVLPLLNDLRAARGENLLSETSLFSPDLSAALPAVSPDALERLHNTELLPLLRKLRQMQQVALVGVLRNQDLPTNLGYMARVFARLEGLCQGAPLGPLWQIASGLVEGLSNGGVANGTSVRGLLRQVDKELKRLVEQGADGINQPASDELTKNLLFYIAKAPVQSPRIRALKDHYRLDDALPDSELVDEERARLAGPDRDAMRSVVAALCEELVRVKDSLDLFVRSDRSGVAELDGLRAPLKQIADTLAMLGFGQPRKVILDQLDVVHQLSMGNGEPTDAALMDIAGALLYVEATLAGMVGQSDDGAGEESHLPTTDVAQIHQLVIKEARTGLEQAKDAIIEFIASQWNHEHLARVPELLTQVRGGLAMIPLERAAELLRACNRYIEEQLLARKAVPNWQSLDTLADAITSVEYYLERLSEDHAAQGDMILDVAEESLGNLGYALARTPILPLPEAAEETPAVLDDPLDEIEVIAEEADHALDDELLPAVEPGAPLLVPVPLDEHSEPIDVLPLEPGESLDEVQPHAALDEAPGVLPTDVEPEPEPELSALSDPLQDMELLAAEAEELVEDEPEPAPSAGESAPIRAHFDEEAEQSPVDAVAPTPAETEHWDLGEPLPEPAAELDSLSAQDAQIEPLTAQPTLEVQSADLPLADADHWDLGEPLTGGDEPAGELDAVPDSPAPQADTETFELPPLDLAAEPAAPALPAEHWDLGEPVAAESAVVDFSLDLPLDELPPVTGAQDEVSLELLPDEPATLPGLDDSWGLGELTPEEPVADFSLDLPLDELPPVTGAQDEVSLELLADEPATLPGLDDSWDLGELAPEEPAADSGLDLPLDELPAVTGAQDDTTLELPELSFESLDEGGLSFDEHDIAALELPEVELPGLSEAHAEVAEPQVEDKPLSMADVMAAPSQAINPPAREVPPSLLPPPADEEPMDEELLEVFIEEAGEVMETIAEYLPKWQADLADKAALTELRRAFHTLKGSGRMVRALVIGELAWSIENLLNRVLDRTIEPDEPVQQVILGVVALMPELVEEFAARAQRQRDDVDQLAAIAHALARGQTPPRFSDGPDSVATSAAVTTAATSQDATEEAEEGLDPQLLEIFRNEADAHLDTLRKFLAACAEELPRPVNDELQRALHTLKGSSHMAGILPMAEIAAPLERMVKELKANLIPLDLAETELLRDAEALFREGLAQLETHPFRPIEGADALISRVQKLLSERLEAAQSARSGESGSVRDPQMIALFLAEGMDILLDASDLLDRWHEHPAERQELGALREELSTLGRGARMAELPQIDELCQALLDTYSAVQDGRRTVSPAFFREVDLSHEALVGMMDQVAAGQQVTAQPERVQALRALLDEVEQVPGELPSALVEQGEEAAAQDAQGWGEPDGETVAEEAVEQRMSHDLPAVQARASSLDEEMVDIFLEEAVDILDSSGQALQRWVNDPENHLVLSSLHRDLHTLRGGAQMAEINPIGELAHELESLYEGLLDRRYGVSAELVALLRRSHDCLAILLDQLKANQPLAAADTLISIVRDFRSSGAAMAHAHQLPPSEVSSEPDAAPEDDAAHSVEPEADTDAALVFEAAPENVPAPAPTPKPVVVEDERDYELVDIFLEEGFDIIDSAGAALQRWMGDVDNSVDLEALQRDLHTLKGGARMAEIREIGDLAHELEFLYEGLCGGRLRASQPLFGLLQACHDRLADMLEAVRERSAVPGGDDLIEAIRRWRANPDEQLSVPTSVHLQPAPSPVEEDEGAEAEILDIFLEEADELLEALEAALGSWEDKPNDSEPIDEMLRVLHTLKGGARLAGQKTLGNLTHALEQRLGEALLQGAPWPQSLVLDVQSGFEGLQKEVDGLRRRLAQSDEAAGQASTEPGGALVLDAPIVAASQASGATRENRVLPFVRRAQEAAQQDNARRGPQELVKVPAELLEGLVNLAGETSIFRGRVEQQVSDVGFTLGEMEATIERVRDQLRRLDTETQAQILSRYQAEAERAGYEDFDPLEMDRHSQLQQLSRALFESASDLLDLKETLAARNRDAETLLLQQARVNTELQEGLMRTRMVPFDRLVPRLRRIVRQVAGELGKQVEFVVGNAEGEMDRSVLERIVAPLEHMLRNAVDHGIESAERRQAAGKPAQGTIRLNLGREGGDILLTLADDGAGIRLEAVRRKAIERGLMSETSEISDHDVLQFILEAGFSTAEKVTQISGRGVGMDVVHSEVKQLGGSMSIDSTPGEGTRFQIRLPFTVSVNRALMVYSGEDLYAIPLNTIEGIVRVSPYELEAYYAPDAPRFEYAGQPYELRYLGDLLSNGQQPKLIGQSLPLPVILVRSAEYSVAVQVDSLAGSREIVVKGLGPQFAGVPGISGATILGDGRVVVILDLLATIRALQARQTHLLPHGSGPLGGEVESERPALVMVVDDSVTVRKVTSRLLERNGMNVLTAKDGVDAIAQLQEQKPDIMLLDIEMPRMDGFEVATLVRHDERLKDLPIIMITSRTGEKHRERAMAIGVNEYLGKPYQESLLLECIQQLVKSHE